MNFIKNNKLALFLIFWGLISLTNKAIFTGSIILATGIYMLPIKFIQDYKEQIMNAQINKNPNLSYENIKTSAKVLTLAILVFCGLIQFCNYSDSLDNTNMQTQTQTQTVMYNQKQIKATNELINSLKNSGLIKKIIECNNNPGFWEITIDENIWKLTAYEHKEMFQVACKIYATSHSNNKFNGYFVKGYYSGKILFTDNSLNLDIK